MTKTLTWLHLSDLHACRPRSGWKAKRILATLRKDLEHLRDKSDLQPDLIFFTGDAAFGHLGDGKGQTLAEQFGHAEELFAGVRKICGVDQENFFLVPGNHDVHRGKVEEMETEWLAGLPGRHGPQAADRVDEFLEKAGRSWRGYMERLADYRAYLEQSGYAHLLSDPDRLVWAGEREIRGLRIGIAGFNTAWSSCRDREKGELWLGSRWQVEHLKAALDELGEAAGRACDLRIALTHHPTGWLSEHEEPRARQGLRSDYQVHLHGHEHEGWVGDETEFLRVAAGACYADSSSEDQSYNLVQLSLKPQKDGPAQRTGGQVWLRQYVARGAGGWMAFQIPGKTDDSGRWALRGAAATAPSPGKVAKPAPGPAAPSARDPQIEAYVQRLRAACRSLPAVGFQQRVRIPLRLDEVYVPLRARIQHELMAGHQRLFGAGRELGMEEDRDLDFGQALELARSKGLRGLLVLGDPGSGKTTLLKHLVLAAPEEIVPVLVELRYLEDPAAGLRPALETALSRADGTLASSEAFAGKLLSRGRLLVLVDGLDEVPDPEQRVEVCRWLERATTDLPHSTFVVTSRYAGYRGATRLDGRFLECHVRDLNQEEIRSFLARWYRAVESQVLDHDETAARRAAEEGARDLEGRLFNPGDPRCASLQKLAKNPLMLQILCLVHRDRNYLPDRRVELYRECVHVMLEEWRRAKQLPVELSAEEALALLQPLAFELHRRKIKQAPAEEILTALERPLQELGHAPEKAESLLATIRDQSGVLVSLDRGDYGFLHLSFQEYLCARHLQNHAFRDQQMLAGLVEHFRDSWWREVVLLAVGLPNPSLFEPLMGALLAAGALDRYSELADACLRETSRASPAPFLRFLARGIDDADERYQALRLLRELPGWQEREVEDGDGARRTGREIVESVAAQEPRSVTASLALELLGRPAPAAPTKRPTRRSPTLRAYSGSPEPGEERIHEPDGSVLIYVPSGEYRLGEELPLELFEEDWKQGLLSKEDLEKWLSYCRPVHTVRLSPFWIAKYPVTNAQYRRFLEENPKAQEPEGWDDEDFNQPEQPVVGISWDEALAYCRWAGLALPSEAQWEAAARGTDERRYPWGDDPPIPEKANFGSEVGRTSPVGSYPAGAGPFGALDQAGNVWEWCRDSFEERAYDQRNGVTDPVVDEKNTDLRVLRGGSWANLGGYLPSACRYRSRAWNRGRYIGFRCLCLARPEP